ncbi:MAG: pyridoxal-phosphate dependent enzyme [Sphingomonas sp.]|nr:pyridoxal-phosphate dependent enzyme [Sphingomonas sp.]
MPSYPCQGSSSSWVQNAIETLEADRQRTADTNLLKLSLPGFGAIDLYLKDESGHPTGSLKHRLARALFHHAISSGFIGEGMHVVEASSGCAAIAEAYFAALLGLEFTAVVPASTAPGKIDAIRRAGGNVHFAPPGSDLTAVAASLSQRPRHYFMNQFLNAERAINWRGRDNIAASIFDQMRLEPHPVPAWIVAGAGTGCTAATIGRHIRHRPELSSTRLCVVDPQVSIFFRIFAGGEPCGPATNSDFIEGIGKKRPSPSFIPQVIDRMVSVPDAASIAAVRWLEQKCGRCFGPSTGTNLVGALALAAGQQGPSSLVLIGGDRGDRYRRTIYDDDWLGSVGIDLKPWIARFANLDRGDFLSLEGLLVHDRPQRHGESQLSPCGPGIMTLEGVSS